MKMCVLCGDHEATLPDRNSRSAGRQICNHCHAERLLSDMRLILEIERKKRAYVKSRSTGRI